MPVDEKHTYPPLQTLLKNSDCKFRTRKKEQQTWDNDATVEWTKNGKKAYQRENVVQKEQGPTRGVSAISTKHYIGLPKIKKRRYDWEMGLLVLIKEN